MSLVHKVYYFQNHLFFLKAGTESSPIVPYELKSVTPALIAEEINAFLKKETDKHFLHANEFEHWNISDRFITVPSPVFDPLLKQHYWDRFFGNSRNDFNLEESGCKSLKVHVISEVPTWLNESLMIQFNQQHSHPFLLELLQESKSNIFQMNILIVRNCFVLALKTNRDLFYFDSNRFDAIDDILYTIINVIKQQNLEMRETECNIYGFCSGLIVQTLKDGIPKIKHLAATEINERVKPFL